jgi:hypothetical protein
MDAAIAGRSDAALARSDKAIEILEPVLNRGYIRARTVLLDNRVFRASMLAGRGDHARATAEAEVVARLGGLGDTNLYNIACVFSRSSAAAAKDGKLTPADRTKLKAQYADHAIEFLHQAVAQGFQNAAALKSDPDLAALRSREDFQKLVQEVERKSGK